MSFWSRDAGPFLFAHRGASREMPENTLPAFQRAMELGADALELDVHVTRDGVFVVSHDPTGERMCNVLRRIADCSWSEIRGWDAGWGYRDAHGQRPHAGQGIRPARLDEVVDVFPGVRLNIDVKEANAAEVRLLIELLRSRNAEERVLLTSFSWRRVRAIRASGYRGSIGLSQLDVVRLVFSPELLCQLARFGGVRAQIPTRSGRIDLSRSAFIEKCHRLGLAVDYWVINEPGEARDLLRRGADGIVTDDPRAVAPVFSQPANSTSH